MAGSSIPVTNLLYVFLFLIPGYLTLRCFIWFGKMPVSLDRFDKTVLSVLLSGVSLSVIAAGYYLVADPGLNDPLAMLSLLQLSVGFLAQMTLNILLGVIGGVIYDYRRDEEVYRPHLWVKTIRDEEMPIHVQVVTQSGAQLSGQIGKYDRTEGTPALLLEDFEVVKEGNNDGVEPRDGSVYISENDISRIWIKKSD